MLTFAEALEQSASTKRHLLLGNGFSIALFPHRFTYGSLLDAVDFSQYPQAKEAFALLNTSDFEVVIQALQQAVTLATLYGVGDANKATMQQHAEALKELLVQSIAGKHPARPGDVPEHCYAACRTFLSHFAGEHRDMRAAGGKDLRGAIFSLNYDLLLYWTLLHDTITEYLPFPRLPRLIPTEPIEHNDGFLADDESPDAEYVVWDAEGSHSQCLSFLHGALHLFVVGARLQKKCWERSGGVPLVDQIRTALSESRFPLFVAEGTSEAKLERIRRSAYLSKGLRHFRANCDVKAASLFLYGHSLGSSDDHILKQIQKAKIGHLYISIYGDPNSTTNREIVIRAQRIAALRHERFPLSLTFYSASTANVWGPTTA